MFSVASGGAPCARDVGGVGYRDHKRFPAQGNPSRFLSFVCPIPEDVRASGVRFVFSIAFVGVPWICDVGCAGYQEKARFPAQHNLPRFVSFVFPILEHVYVRVSRVGVSVFYCVCQRALGMRRWGRRMLRTQEVPRAWQSVQISVFCLPNYVGVPWASDVGVVG